MLILTGFNFKNPTVLTNDTNVQSKSLLFGQRVSAYFTAYFCCTEVMEKLQTMASPVKSDPVLGNLHMASIPVDPLPIIPPRKYNTYGVQNNCLTKDIF